MACTDRGLMNVNRWRGLEKGRFYHICHIDSVGKGIIMIIGEIFFQVGVKADEVKVGTKTRILTNHWQKIPTCIFTRTISTQKQAYRNPATK